MSMLRVLPVLIALAAPAGAEEARAVAVEASRDPSGWTFSVTVRSPDAGWDRYADGWEVTTVEGTRIGYRELLHPHVEEQPFTRSLSGVAVPPGARDVLVRVHDSVDGWGPPFRLTLPGGG